jgi:hypothetical protein
MTGKFNYDIVSQADIREGARVAPCNCDSSGTSILRRQGYGERATSKIETTLLFANPLKPEPGFSTQKRTALIFHKNRPFVSVTAFV